MRIDKLKYEFQKVRHLTFDDWMTVAALIIAAISVAIYMDKIRSRVTGTLAMVIQDVIEEAEEVAKKAQEVEV